MKKVKFLKPGKWSDHPQDPVFEVKEDEEKDVSDELANIAVKAGKAVLVEEKPKAAKILDVDGGTKPMNPAPDKSDKAKSKNPAPDKKDKAKAEHK